MAYDKILVITDSLHIHAILKNVANNNANLQVRLQNTEYSATSRIMRVDFDAQHLILDELIAGKELEQAVKSGNLLTLSGTNNSVKFRFHAALDEVGENNRIPYYKLSYPTELEYAQRRQLFRLELGQDWQFPVKIIDKASTHDALARNISLGGLNIKCDESLVDYSARDNLNLLLSLPDAQPVHCTAHICNIRVQNKKQSDLACKFIELDDHKVKLIQRYISRVQRESRIHNSSTATA